MICYHTIFTLLTLDLPHAADAMLISCRYAAVIHDDTIFFTARYVFRYALTAIFLRHTMLVCCRYVDVVDTLLFLLFAMIRR